MEPLIATVDLMRRHDEPADAVIPSPGGASHHEGSHYANIRYGYILVFISIIGMIWIAVTNSINTKNTRFSNSRLKFGRFSFKRLNLNHLLSKPSPKLVLFPLWILMLIFLALNGHSYSTLNGFAKRLGRVTFAIIPLILFLSLRPSPLPNTYYIRLLALHKWVARSAILIGSLHGILYTTYFIKSGTTAKLLKVDNFLGIILLIGFLTVFITSVRPLRIRYYRIFYLLHYPLAWSFVIIGCFHARPGVTFLAIWSVFILAGQVFYKIFTSRTIRIIENYPISSTLYSITLPRDIMPDYFPVGSHIRLNKGSLISPLTWLQPSHPYTIASLSTDEDNVRLLIRKTKFTIDTGSLYTISGPFASTIIQQITTKNPKDEGPEYTAVNDGIGARKVVIFAGGSGLSFAAPLVRELNTMGTSCRLIWITRDKSDLKSLDVLNIEEIDVFITGNNSSNKYSDILDRGDNSKPTIPHNIINDEEAEAIEFDELLLDSDHELEPPTPGEDESDLQSDPKSSISPTPTKVNITYGRPDFDRSIDNFILPGQEQTSWAIACGPRLLVQDVESWASRKKVHFMGEKYFL